MVNVVDVMSDLVKVVSVVIKFVSKGELFLVIVGVYVSGLMVIVV